MNIHLCISTILSPSVLLISPINHLMTPQIYAVTLGGAQSAKLLTH